MKTNFITYELNNEEYHEDRTHISSSGLKMCLRNPEEYYNNYILNLRKNSTAALDVGSYTHTLVLEPELVNSEYVYCEHGRNTKKFREFKDQNPGKTCLDPKDVKVGIDLAIAANRNPLLQQLLTEGAAECSIFANIDGLYQKVRLDFVSPTNHILDLKTCREPLSKMSVERIIEERDYDLSAYMYMRVWNHMVTEEDYIDTYYLAFISKSTKQVMIKKLSKWELMRGKDKYQKSIKKFKEMRENGDLEPINESKVY